MTDAAICRPVPGELSGMNIQVAGIAFHGDSCKLLPCNSFSVLFKMTVAARFLCMRTFKYKVRLFMIKIDRTPAGYIMTGLTRCSGIILFIDIILVNIAMTIAAVNANPPEAPFRFFFMTCDTGRRHVGAIQAECTLIVLFHRIGRLTESLYRMAFSTIRRDTVL